MRSQSEIDSILRNVQDRLDAKRKGGGLGLHVPSGGYLQSDDWLREHPPIVAWWSGQFESASIPVDHPIVTTVGAAFTAITGGEPTYQGMPYGADMRLLVNNGNTPTLMFGPGNVRKAHQPDEYVPVEDLAVVVKTLALTALRFCGYEE